MRKSTVCCKTCCKATRSLGFTLTELLIALAIGAILAIVAVPSYISHIEKARRVEGISTLLKMNTLMERYYANNGTYATATVTALMGSTSSEGGYYTISLNPLAAESYTLQAAPASSQTDDDCGTYTLDSVGTHSVTGGSLSASDCW